MVNEKKNKIDSLMSGIEYIKWLIDFTEDKEIFSDEDWDYSSEKLTDDDQEKVYDLSLFFEGIYRYARDNHIYSKPRVLGEYYQIKIGDIGFEIGYITGQGTCFYCRRIPVEDNFIDFLDILINKKQDNVELIEKNLEELSNMITNIYNNGVPMESITKRVNLTMKDIILKEREEKKLIKKL